AQSVASYGLRVALNRPFCRFQSRRIVGVFADFLDVLNVTQLVVGVEHKDRSALDSQIGYQRSIMFSERSEPVIGKHGDAVNAEISAPALLRKRQIHADREDPDI